MPSANCLMTPASLPSPATAAFALLEAEDLVAGLNRLGLNLQVLGQAVPHLTLGHHAY